MVILLYLIVLKKSKIKNLDICQRNTVSFYVLLVNINNYIIKIIYFHINNI